MKHTPNPKANAMIRQAAVFRKAWLSGSHIVLDKTGYHITRTPQAEQALRAMCELITELNTATGISVDLLEVMISVESKI